MTSPTQASPTRRSVALAVIVSAVLIAIAPLGAWGLQGHRLVGLVAANHLDDAGRRGVARLLDDRTLADVSNWADDYLSGNNQTSFWHYVNIPREATAYDRDRDCPPQPGVSAGSRRDIWRDCIVDRIKYNEERVADASLDRADRAIALKFLVHFVGDIHQPLHATAVARGGNGILVSKFGSPDCQTFSGMTVPCNLHGIWDSDLIARRQLSDSQYVDALEQLISRQRLESRSAGTAADWAMESLVLANKGMVESGANIDEAYYRAQIAVIEERLALGGLRLATMLNRVPWGR